ncbi:hypothetical protein LTR36_004835 [Oleoguttula mirabilis]|uniref:Uncharacterized protein n=1 Tax=Oleoguttula mirabilis TaxID=1507867 RepID=A0AAV9JFG5_9PEZI|nr:hypothetical protein LTR36_004835 [Oleoguttula mirabilis]
MTGYANSKVTDLSALRTKRRIIGRAELELEEDMIIALRHEDNRIVAASTSFFTLPVEIRNIIYEDCLPATQTLLYSYTDSPADTLPKPDIDSRSIELPRRPLLKIRTRVAQQPTFQGSEPALCQTNRQMRAETVPLFYAHQKFLYGSELASISGIQAWAQSANTFATPLLAHVRHLHLSMRFEYTHKCPADAHGGLDSTKTGHYRLQYVLQDGVYDTQVSMSPVFRGNGDCYCKEHELEMTTMPLYREAMAVIEAGFGGRILVPKQAGPQVTWRGCAA